MISCSSIGIVVFFIAAELSASRTTTNQLFSSASKAVIISSNNNKQQQPTTMAAAMSSSQQQQQQEPVVAPQAAAPQPGAHYLVIVIGGMMLSVAMGVMLVDYCKHLRRTGIFDRRNKETAAMYRRQALMTIAEIPNNVDMMGPMLIQEIGASQMTRFEKIDEEADTAHLLAKSPPGDNERPKFCYENYGQDKQPAVPPDSERRQSKSSASSLSRASNSKTTTAKERRRLLKQQQSTTSQSHAANKKHAAANKVIETSKSNSQMALFLKNYGTFDSQVELQFFNEAIPNMSAVSKYLPMKQQMSLNEMRTVGEVDASPPASLSDLSRSSSMTPNLSRTSSRGETSGGPDLGTTTGVSSVSSSSNTQLHLLSKQQSTALPTIRSNNSAANLTPINSHSDIPRVEPVAPVNQQPKRPVGLPFALSLSCANSCDSSGSSVLDFRKGKKNGLTGVRPASDNALELRIGSDDNSSATSGSLQKITAISQTHLTPPKFLPLNQRSSSDTTTCLLDGSTNGLLSPHNLSVDADICIRRKGSNASINSNNGGLVMRKSSSAKKRSLLRKAASPLYATVAEKVMAARMAQLYQFDTPDHRASSVSDVFASKQRLMLIEAQRRRKRAETLRRRKRRLNGNGGSMSPVIVGRSSSRHKARMLISTMRVPLRNDWKVYK